MGKAGKRWFIKPLSRFVVRPDSSLLEAAALGLWELIPDRGEGAIQNERMMILNTQILNTWFTAPLEKTDCTIGAIPSRSRAYHVFNCKSLERPVDLLRKTRRSCFMLCRNRPLRGERLVVHCSISGAGDAPRDRTPSARYFSHY
ncbi:MAG: hypothetical protein ACI8PG_004523 [Planctomycetota bacterium]|jgi:hypothetical protein